MKASLSWLIYDRSLYEQKWKDNKGYALVILKVVRIINLSSPEDSIERHLSSRQHFKLVTSKTSRIFVYVGNNKYFSCTFPFHLVSRGSGYCVQYEDIEITNKLLSEAISLLNDMDHGFFYNRFRDAEEDADYTEEAYIITEKLLTTEPCYVRYDHDKAHASHHIHPEIHLDINMSKAASFKIGLIEPLERANFEGLFEKEKDCYYCCKPDQIGKRLKYVIKKKKHKRKF